MLFVDRNLARRIESVEAQRNYQRQAFQPAYTKPTFQLENAKTSAS